MVASVASAATKAAAPAIASSADTSKNPSANPAAAEVTPVINPGATNDLPYFPKGVAPAKRKIAAAAAAGIAEKSRVAVFSSI